MPVQCVNCGTAFSIEPEEIEWVNANGKELPNLCPRCRAFKAGLHDESITCSVCGRVFVYPRELRLYSRMFNWPRPRRCLGGCKGQASCLSEVEQTMADFLRRLRLARKLNTPLSSGSQDMTVGRTYRLGGDLEFSRQKSSSGNAQSSNFGGSLAQALKEFQEKKRRRG